MSSHSVDVLIIGAGAAGLAAAAELAPSGSSVLVLEARDRIGGRIWSLQDPSLPVPIELGAEFIHGRAEAMFFLLARAGRSAIDAPDDHWIHRDGELAPMDHVFPEIQQAMQKTAALEKGDLSFEAFLAGSRRNGLSNAARTFARMLVQGFDAADPKRVSARAIMEEWGAEGVLDAPQFRPLGGYGPLVESQASAARSPNVSVALQTLIHTIRWRRGSVSVEGTRLGKPFRARAARAIVTLPLSVLQVRSNAPGAVRFVPALEEKRAALNHLGVSPVLKIALRFRSSFWEELEHGRYQKVAFFHSTTTPFPTFWTALPVRAPLLTAWVGGPKVVRLSRLDPLQIVRQAIRSLESIFGAGARPGAQLESYRFHDWQRDPLSRGAYSYVTVGGDTARQSLASPIRETLFFAGEATDTEGEASTVSGALGSGSRAARELLGAGNKRRKNPRESPAP